MAPRKSSAIIPAGSATSRFRSGEHATYYRKLLEEKITISRTLDESKIKYRVLRYFTSSSLRNLLQLAFPFNKDFIYELYANMEIPFSRDRIISRVLGRDVELTREDFHTHLGLSISGASVHSTVTDGGFNWVELNLELRNAPIDSHVALLDGLKESARVVQHILRTSVFPKVGDKTAITPVLSASTYFILTGRQFDETDALIRYIDNTMSVRLAHVKRKQNLVLGHVLSFLLFSKYQIRSPRACDAPPVFYSNASFHILFGPKRSGAAPAAVGGDPEEEAEYGRPEASRPMFHGETSSSRASTFDFDGLQTYLDTRFDQIDTHFDLLEAAQANLQGDLLWIRSHMEGPQVSPSDPTED